MALERLRKRIKFLHPKVYRLLTRTRPKLIQIQTTSVCNANCDFCPYPVVSKEVSMGNMSQNLFEKIVREGFDLGIEGFSLYLMNEPFVDPRMIERIQFVKDLGGSVNLSTNASLMTEEVGRAAFKAGLTRLAINMPSVDRDEFKRLVSKLDFDQVVANLDALSKYQSEYKTQVTVQVNVSSDRNKEEIERTVAHWRQHGMNVQIRQIMDRAGNLGKYVQNIYIHNLAGCFDFREVAAMHVLYNGEVILCCQDWRRGTILGNVSEASLKDIYFGEPYFHIRKQISGLEYADKNMICRRCEFAVPGDRKSN